MMWFLGRLFLLFIYYPLLTVLKFFVLPLPKVRERFHFERQNNTERLAQSFSRQKAKADLCFEFSSEGEYQQVASLIEDALIAGKKLELVFFSPSVEKTVVALAARYPEQIRYLRFCILDLTFSNWITSPELILVRYDLFPEFLVWSLKPNHRLSFVWVTFKKERVAGKSVSWFKRAFLMLSQNTVFASESDMRTAKELGFHGGVYDFRMEQIKRRIEGKFEKFQELFKLYPALSQHLKQFSQKKIIIGNAWPVDVSLLKNIPQDYLIFIVPHQLKPEIIQSMQSELKNFGREAIVIDDQTMEFRPSQTYILNKKGVLCELYSDFERAYVGGGFGVSVHSILEPLMAGCEFISCGPVHHRSTEYDIAEEYGRILEVKNAEDFKTWALQSLSGSLAHAKLKSQIDQYPVFRKEILKC